MNITIKRLLPQCLLASAVLLAISALATSCKNDEVIEPTPLCAITSFSVEDITSYVAVDTKDASGNTIQTVVSRTMSGSDIHFNIDQLNGRIFSVNPLPTWIDLTHVKPIINCYGSVYRRFDGDEAYYAFESGSDTIDLSREREMLCLATDGVSKKLYTVVMEKSAYNLDTLEWSHKPAVVPMQQVDKVLRVGNALTAFGLSAADGTLACATTTDGNTWTDPVGLSRTDIDAGSVTLFRDSLYAVASGGTLLASADGIAWEELPVKCDDLSASSAIRLLGADGCYLYITDGTVIFGTANRTDWTKQGTADIDRLPQTCLNLVSYTSRTNSNLKVAVLAGLNTGNARPGTVWHKMSSTDPQANQQWAYIQPTADNGYPMPNLDGMSVTFYQNAFYAIGTTGGAFAGIYRSYDNGVTWRQLPSKYPLPADIMAAGGKANLVTTWRKRADGQAEELLWIVQQDGNVWSGIIR